ncbi:CsiV family protein [Colwellia sp. 1_MG-2023]|uniref:CsiV family protein n=1 Tax=Colwellia sp. 1_MG-2023 TaxID=3062649 RepID=UPI0026E3FB34|nr:CsiV family protein [Colwellia sp. 1_MG-2023]MDO6445756.1 CsiV family protein [Colwellia sp. 1_MG-2023]
MNIKQSLVLFSSLFFSLSAMSASKWLGDWFEIEVILISQLDDKTKSKESFSEQDFTINYANSLDLITPYLNPDIESLKQLLPVCNQINDQRTYLEQSTVWPTFYLNKTLSDLNEEQIVEQALVNQQNSTGENNTIMPSESANHDQVPPQAGDNDNFFDRMKTKQEQLKAGFTYAEKNNKSHVEANNSSDEDLDSTLIAENKINDSLITEEQKALVIEAEQVFSKIQFNQYINYPVFAKTNKNNKASSALCAISLHDFMQLNVDKNLYSYHGFQVNAVPTTIDDVEHIYSDIPYLLSEDSLRLKDIVKQLRRSKDFRPILHLAWRQPVFEKQDSQPLKIFAGDNLQGQYVKNLATYHAEKQASLIEEQSLNAIFTLSENHQKHTIDNSTEVADFVGDMKKEIKSAKINEILHNIHQVNNVEDVVARLNNPAEAKSPLNAINNNVMIENKPLAPVQPWYLEGLIDVYLIGNYLHVANDFSILNMTLAEQESLKLKTSVVGDTADFGEVMRSPKAIPIRMTQDRRMISREVHYFDHPYMGMIIQIRRHQRPELPMDDSEEVIVNTNN